MLRHGRLVPAPGPGRRVRHRTNCDPGVTCRGFASFKINRVVPGKARRTLFMTRDRPALIKNSVDRHVRAPTEANKHRVGAMARTLGTVKWFNDAEGFGFITPENGDKDCFVHHTAIKAEGFRSLAEGDRVEFDIVQGAKGPAAENVVKLK